MREIVLQDVERSPIADTLAKGKKLLDPMTGIIRSIIPNWLEQGDAQVYAFGAVSMQASPLNLEPQISRAGGASIERDHAIAATIGEAAERYCSAYCEDQLIFASYSELKDSDAMHPSSFPLYSERQYSSHAFPYCRFDENTKLSWTWGYSLQRRCLTLVPARLVYLPMYVEDQTREANISSTTSTGLACGGTLEEAILSGVGEIVERDALTCFWMNRLPHPHVKIDEDCPIWDIFTEKFAVPGLRYYTVDATTDLGIPTFVTLLIGDSNYGRMINVGSQASPATYRAALKSLVEAAHGRPYARFLIQQNPGWRSAADFSNVVEFTDHATFYTRSPEHFGALDFMMAPRETRRLSDIPDASTGSVKGDIDLYMDRLGRKGLDMIVVDLTSPDVAEVGLRVVRVLVPGLQLLHGDHRYPFLGCPRLYEIAERLGYRRGLTTEEDLNPYPHPLP